MTFLRKFTFCEETIHLYLLIQCNESNCEGIHAFVLNIKNCKFKLPMVKIKPINKRLSFSLSLPLSRFKCVRKGRWEAENGRIYFYDGGMLKDGP